MTDDNSQHFGNLGAIQIRIQINPEIRIPIPHHFWLRLDALAEVCILWVQSSCIKTSTFVFLHNSVASLTRVRVVVDHTMLTPLQRSTQLKILHWYFDQSLPHQDFIFCQTHLEQAFFFYIIVFHSHPFNEMCIVSGKTHCCNNTFTDVRFQSLLAKDSYEEYKLILCG